MRGSYFIASMHDVFFLFFFWPSTYSLGEEWKAPCSMDPILTLCPGPLNFSGQPWVRAEDQKPVAIFLSTPAGLTAQ